MGGPPVVTGPSMGDGSPADGVPSAADVPSSVNKPVGTSTVQDVRKHLEVNEQEAQGKGEKKVQKTKQQTAEIGKKPTKKGKGDKREPVKDNSDSGTSPSPSDSDEHSDGDHGGANCSDVGAPRTATKDGGKIQQNNPSRRMKTRSKK